MKLSRDFFDSYGHRQIHGKLNLVILNLNGQIYVATCWKA
jgi:hypothetical protein